MKVYCCICARQIVNYPVFVSDRWIIADKNPIVMGPRQYCCHECAHNNGLDRNGMFPEEYSMGV